jgi:phage shock protein C
MHENRPLYRSRNGRFLGVCRGIAEYFGLKPIHVRMAFVLAALFTGFWPVLGFYLLLGLVMKPEPLVQPNSADEEDFYEFYSARPGRAMDSLRERYERIERRIRRLEDHVTSREKDWDRRFNGGAG